MKRLLCLVLCLMMTLSFAMAEDVDTLPKRFIRQMSGGNGARGYLSVSASGVAEWLDALLPFTASDIQIRAIGQKQGEASATITDDDDWQVKFYVKDDQGKEQGVTWLYGDPQGLYFRSDLLPDTVLTYPVEQAHLLYQIFRGEFDELFFAFDPLDMKEPGKNGNAPAYEAVAQLLGIPETEWEAKWLPVLEKYFLHLDLWLTSFGDPSFMTGEVGTLTMSADFTIPVEDLKAEAKYLISQLLYDSELQSLLLPYVTMEQRITYLNPQMLYFYEACIDALEISGDVILSREMSAMGEVVSSTISLPVPPMPDALTAPAEELAANLLGLPKELLSGINRITLKQSGKEKSVTLNGDQKTFTISAIPSSEEEGVTALSGKIALSSAESNYSAAYTLRTSHKIWQDEDYKDRDTTAFFLSVTPDDAEVKPTSLAWTVDYINNPFKQDSAVQVTIDAAAQLPDAEIAAKMVLRISTQIKMQTLSTLGGEDVTQMTEERKNQLLDTFVQNAVTTVENLDGNAQPVLAPAEAAPTAVPPAAE